ncbi:MAG: hypothetical protein RLZZ164_124 [Actinomycetota bacterium]
MASLQQNYLAVIKVIGVGGHGVNAINRMIERGQRGVEFIAINTDAQQLVMSEADVKIDIGREVTRGLGAGADPSVGRRAAEDHEDEIELALRGADMIFVAAGEGGGTGTGASPVVARIAKRLGALTVGVVTTPWSFEGKRRAEQAERGIEELRAEVDTLIVIPNELLIKNTNSSVTVLEALKIADDPLVAGVQGITDLIVRPGLINVDFADVRTVLQGAGSALMGIGAAKGEDRAIRAAEAAITSPMTDTTIDGALGVLVLVEGATNLSVHEMYQAQMLVKESVSPEANIIAGLSVDDTLGDEVRVTVVAAGLDPSFIRRRPVETAAPAQVRETPVASNGFEISGRSTQPETGGVEINFNQSPATESIAVVEEPYQAPKQTGFGDDLDIPDFLK